MATEENEPQASQPTAPQKWTERHASTILVLVLLATNAI